MRPIPATLAALTLLCSTTLVHAADIGFHKTYAASGTTALNVCGNSGVIHVVGVDGNKIQISGIVHKSNWHAVGNTEDMKKIAANPPVGQTGNAIHAGDTTTCGANGSQDIAVDYDISVPRDTTVVAKSRAGTIRIESINGSVHASTGSGDILVNGIGAGSSLATGTGNLEIQAAHGALRAVSGSGNLVIRDSEVTEARLDTGSGNITAAGLKGAVRANTGNGNLTMAGSPTGDWEMRTGNGKIEFQAAPSSKFELDAETGSGTIDSTLPSPVSGHGRSGVLRGPVNGGGPEVKMYTGSGNITLQ